MDLPRQHFHLLLRLTLVAEFDFVPKMEHRVSKAWRDLSHSNNWSCTTFPGTRKCSVESLNDDVSKPAFFRAAL
jgi:hypothetical protein